MQICLEVLGFLILSKEPGKRQAASQHLRRAKECVQYLWLVASKLLHSIFATNLSKCMSPVVFCFFFCYYHVAFILHSAYNRTLLVAAADLRAAVLPAERTGNPLVLSSVSLENVLSITPFIFSTHMHLYFFSFQCVKGCRCYYSFFFFFLLSMFAFFCTGRPADINLFM